MAKKIPIWKEKGFDSQDEWHFSFWLAEAHWAGYLHSFSYQPKPAIPLSDKAKYQEEIIYKTKVKQIEKTKIVTRHLLAAHTYQPDFDMVLSAKFRSLDHGLLKIPYGLDGLNILVEIKPIYQRERSRAESFSINQKWLYQKWGIMVHKIVPETFFKKTWVPEACAFWENGKRRIARYAGCKLLKEYRRTCDGQKNSQGNGRGYPD